MANVNLLISNPTTSDVTVNSQTAKAHTVTPLTIADTGSDVYGFLAAGCAVVSVSGTADLSAREKAVYVLYRLMHRQ